MSSFGITPSQIAFIAAQWRELGAGVTDVDVPAPAGSTSTAIAAAAGFCERATTVCGADGRRLAALGDALAVFNALTAESDTASAAAMGDAADSPVR